MIRSFALLVSIISLPAAAHAQIDRDTAASLGVDVLLLRGGGELRGSIVNKDDGVVRVAVRRTWLRQHDPERFEKQLSAERQDAQAANRQLIERIDKWLAELPDDSPLAPTVRLQREEAQQALAEGDLQEQPGTSEFVLLEVREADVRRVFAQPPRRKQVALVAWRERIEDVEQRSILRLEEELEKREIEWREAEVDLADRLPLVAEQDEREWAARKALYSYTFVQPLDFQGTGDVVFETGKDAAPAELAGVLSKLLGNTDLKNLLDDPLAAPEKPKSWLDQASAAAEKQGAQGFRVTRSELDIEQNQAVVDDQFVARMPDGSWQSVWHNRTTLATSEARDDLTQRIREDPQVGASLKLLEQLGLGANVSTAVKFGAATMEAQQESNRRFFAFRDRFTEHLAGPPLRWPSAE